MKISLSCIAACLLSITWLEQVQSRSVDYRYKRRGHPPPPRPPPMKQYIKKWDQHRPPRGSQRPRPIIPMHAVPDFMPPPVMLPPVLSVGPPIIVPTATRNGPPVGPPMGLSAGKPVGPAVRATPPPVKSYWKHTKTPVKTVPEKAFQYSPPISSTHEFDYHIQTNSIPTHNIPIKQLGEKGPIHTIPAPNLSLADKPIVVEEIRSEPKKQQSFIQQHNQAPQYQVTEPSEGYNKNPQKFFREQQAYYSPNVQAQNYDVYQQPAAESFINVQEDPRLTSKELYQLINSQMQQKQQHQQPAYEVMSLPQALLQQQQQIQQIPGFIDYQAMLAQSQLFQPEQSYPNQLQQQEDNSFASERHAQSNFPRTDDQSTFITADYNLKAEGSNTASYSVQDPSNPEPNLPYVQEIFNLNNENTASANKVEQNINNAEGDNEPVEKEEEKAGGIGSAFYTSLPNRQAADALASLQAAGKVNSNLMQVLPQQRSQNIKVNQRTPLEIFVPDSQSLESHEIQQSEPFQNQNHYPSRGKNQDENVNDANLEDYDDSSLQENESTDEQDDTLGNGHQTQNQNSFGSRLRPKQNQ